MHVLTENTDDYVLQLNFFRLFSGETAKNNVHIKKKESDSFLWAIFILFFKLKFSSVHTADAYLVSLPTQIKIERWTYLLMFISA